MIDWTLHDCPALEERYYETRHPRGLRILVAPKDLSAAYVTLGVAYGSRDRLAGGALPMGIAHFLEHKMFEKSGGGSWEDTFSALGAEVNAYTSDDATAYMFTATDHVEEGIEALLSMVGELSVTGRSVARERKIIAEEIRMNADDPWEVCYANMLRGLYPPVKRAHLRPASEPRGNPVREEICGTEASIRRITPAALREAHRRFYRPDAMTLAVSGRIPLHEVAAAVEAVLGPFDQAPSDSVSAEGLSKESLSKESLSKESLSKESLSKDRPRSRGDGHGVWKPRVTATMDTAKPLFSIGIKLDEVPHGGAELVELDRLATLLSEVLFSRSGDFYDRLFEEGIISPGISYGASLGRATADGGEGYGYLYFSGECDDPEAVFEAFRRYMTALSEGGMEAEAFTAAFERARRTMYADFVYSFDSTEGIASSLQAAAMDGVELFDLLRLDRELTLPALRALGRRLQDPANYTLSTVQPTARTTGARQGHKTGEQDKQI